jgi:hypothetical protein
MLEELPEGTEGSFGDAYLLLVALGSYGDASTIEIFRKYAKSGTVARCLSLCYALRETRQAWAVELLSPLLADQRDTDWKAESPQRRLVTRVCDVAAETLKITNPGIDIRPLRPKAARPPD